MPMSDLEKKNLKTRDLFAFVCLCAKLLKLAASFVGNNDRRSVSEGDRTEIIKSHDTPTRRGCQAYQPPHNAKCFSLAADSRLARYYLERNRLN